MDAEALERRLDAVQHLLDRVARALRELLDVRAVVAVLRRLLPAPRGLDGRAKAFHLRAGVVVVVLARDVVPAEGEQAPDRVSVRAVPRVRDRDRPGRVRRHHLDLHALAPLGPAAAELLARVEDRAERADEPGVDEEEIDEAGPCRLRALDLRQRLRRLDELCGDLARRLPARTCKPKRGVRRVVAVLGVTRPLERRRRCRRAPRAR